MKTNDRLNGAWEEPGVIGTRIEIDGSGIVIFWRNTPVLQTTFKTVETDGKTELVLNNRGLRNKGASYDYALVTSLVLDGRCLELNEEFTIAGESKTILKKTENSRYGNYDICDDVLNELNGLWKDKNGYFELEFNENVLSVNGRSRTIHVLRSRGERNGGYIIADSDPSVYEFEGFSRPVYCGGTITAYLLVCDAPSVFLVFEKIK